MARPSTDTDKLLIKAARELLPETGCSGLNIRQVAQLAGVNLGMFHYHFKNKENFVQQVLQELYEELYWSLPMKADSSENSIEKLRSVLTSISHFARDNRSVVLALLRDAFNKDQEVIKFAKKHFMRHFKIIIQLLNQAKSEGLIKDYPIPFLVTYVMGSVALPIALYELLVKNSARKPFGIVLSLVKKSVLSDEALAARIDLTLTALSKTSGGRK